MDSSPPGSSVHGISQTSILEWAAISFFRGYSQSRDQNHTSHMGRCFLYHWVVIELFFCFRSSKRKWTAKYKTHSSLYSLWRFAIWYILKIDADLNQRSLKSNKRKSSLRLCPLKMEVSASIL